MVGKCQDPIPSSLGGEDHVFERRPTVTRKGRVHVKAAGDPVDRLRQRSRLGALDLLGVLAQDRRNPANTSLFVDLLLRIAGAYPTSPVLGPLILVQPLCRR